MLTADLAKGMSDDAAAVLRGRTATVSGGDVLDTALGCDLSAYDAELMVLGLVVFAGLASPVQGLAGLGVAYTIQLWWVIRVGAGFVELGLR